MVGLYGFRSPSVVWAIMGILKAGAAYSMMVRSFPDTEFRDQAFVICFVIRLTLSGQDPAYPSSRIKACMDIAKPRAWLQIHGAIDAPVDLVQYLDGLGCVSSPSCVCMRCVCVFVCVCSVSVLCMSRVNQLRFACLLA